MRKLTNASKHRINTKGDKWYLWRNPHLGNILHLGWPFIKTLYLTNDMHHIIHWIHVVENSIFFHYCSNKSLYHHVICFAHIYIFMPIRLVFPPGFVLSSIQVIHLVKIVNFFFLNCKKKPSFGYIGIRSQAVYRIFVVLYTRKTTMPSFWSTYLKGYSDPIRVGFRDWIPIQKRVNGVS